MSYEFLFLPTNYITKLIHIVSRFCSCMYILPKDIHKDTMDIIPYGFEVDIIKDYSSLQKDIADVFNVIDRESPSYVQTIEKVFLIKIRNS